MASPKFTSAIEGIAMDVKDVACLPSLDWKVFCRNPPDEGACVHCQNLLTPGNRHPISHNCFPHALVDQTKAQSLPKCAEANPILNKRMRHSPFP